MRARSRLVCALVLAACESEIDPYCSEVDDPSGRGVALCRDGHEQPVCDDPGETARFERDAAGVSRLVGGEMARCDESRQVVCADRTTSPRCIRELTD